ncbi:MAG: cell wall hydrolase [Alphaproteobacteria bacterium]|nr:cell wall hydrolase [Alphaproteobacteria bacterium]
MTVTTSPPFTPEDLDIMARTIWGEARGEGIAGQRAVAHVIVNRARRGGWWGDTIAEVCRKPYQFSAWNPGDPNRRKMLGLAPETTDYLVALAIAYRAAAGIDSDPTGGADHYHTTDVEPWWSGKLTRLTSIGSHIFLKG